MSRGNMGVFFHFTANFNEYVAKCNIFDKLAY